MSAHKLAQLFDPDVHRTLVYARDLRPDMVVTAGRRGRAVIRQAFPLPESGRILATYSLVDECTGVIGQRVHDMPVQDGVAQHELVAATVPSCLTYADAVALPAAGQ